MHRFKRDAHAGPIHVLCEADGVQPAGSAAALLSCGKDGCVRSWQWQPEGRQLVALALQQRHLLLVRRGGGLGVRRGVDPIPVGDGVRQTFRAVPEECPSSV